ncbi:MAG: hypothetical protein RLZZ618_4006 [Pseudomonadota bacterium]
MTRLQTQWHRLYLPDAGTPPAPGGEPVHGTPLIGPQGQVRAMVLELARPADWDAVALVWRGVQAELDLPAPAIAVSGTDGFQLWFSTAEAVPVAQAQAFLAALRHRFLPDVAAKRVSLWPAADPAAPGEAVHAPPVPAQQRLSGDWSAFVAPDLAAVFADTPWLDLTPSDDGQADLLTPLRSITTSAWDEVWAKLHPELAQANVPHAAVPAVPTASPSVPRDPKAPGAAAEHFLLQVMNDESQPMALRIEAARALLPARR